VAETKNHTIMEVVKDMIHDQDLPMHMWEEEARTDVYVQKISPHHVMGNKTPKEIFSGENPEVNHLRIFGFTVYIHVPEEKRSKLDPSRKKGIFLGYNESSKEYRVYIPGHQRIEVSRDVTLDEDTDLNKSRNNHLDEVHDEDLVAPRISCIEGYKNVVLGKCDPKDHDMMEP
jgi:hypothetical protein